MSGRGALLLTTHPPGSGTGSGVRARLTLQALRTCCDHVDAVSFAFPSEWPFADSGVHLVPRPAPAGRWAYLAALGAGGSPFVEEREGRLVDHVRRLVAEGALRDRYDLVWSHFAVMARAGLAVEAARRVLDVDSSLGAATRRGAREAGGTPAQRLYHRLDAAAVACEERRRCDVHDRVVVASERERGCLATIRPPVTVIANATSTVGGPAGDRERGGLLFVGSLDYLPNVEAVGFLVGEVLPRLRARRPDARLTLAGRNPGRELEALARDAGVRLVAGAPSLEPLYAGARAVVAPLWLGGGTRIKVIEAMAWALPIVATPVAVEGLDLRHGESVLLADDAEGFAGHCAAVLADPDLAARLGRRAREVWWARHRPEAVRGAVAAVVEELLAPAAAPISLRRGERAAASAVAG